MATNIVSEELENISKQLVCATAQIGYAHGNTTLVLKSLLPIVPLAGTSITAGKCGRRLALAYQEWNKNGIATPTVYLNTVSGVLSGSSCILNYAGHLARYLHPQTSEMLFVGAGLCSSAADSLDNKYDLFKSFLG